MLGDHIGAIRNAIVSPESQFLEGMFGEFKRGGSDRAVEYLRKSARFRTWFPDFISDATFDVEEPADLFDAVLTAYGRSIGATQSADLWIDHTPSNFKRYRFLRTLFPEAKFIHIVRDPRAVIASVLRLDWGPCTVLQAAHWWLREVATPLCLENHDPGHCIRVRYEDVINGDERYWSDLAERLNLPEAPLARLMGGGNSRVPNYTLKQHKLVGKGPRADRAWAWREKLSEREIEVVEAIVGSAMWGLGYEGDYELPREATRMEKLRTLDWPVQVRSRPWKLARKAVRERSR